MASTSADAMLEQIYRMAESSARTALSDRQLLQLFAQQQEQSAFSALVRRHGPMVFAVCLRILRHRQDAEDAFQATFMVLARKVDCVQWHESIANWLYGTACRTAMKQRSRQAQREDSIAVEYLPERAVSAAEPTTDMQPILDEELQSLPNKYRAPLVLCYLEGKTRDEAAQLLGWTMPTVKGRLERGRNLLRQRLLRRGVMLSTAALFASLGQSAARADVSSAMVRSTVEAGAAVAGNSLPGLLASQILEPFQEAMSTMISLKLKLTALAALAAIALGVSVGIVAQQTQAENPVASAEKPAAAPQDGFFVNQERAEERKTIRGMIKALDLKQGTITLTIHRDGEEKREEVFSLAGKNIKVFTNVEIPATLDDLKPGVRVALILSDAGDVAAIQIGRGEREGERRDGEQRSYVGQMVSVDEKAPTVTILIRRDAGDEKKTLPVAKNARIFLGEERPAKLGDLGKDKLYMFRLTEDGTAVFDIRPFRRDVERRAKAYGLVKSVDLKKRTLTISIPRENGISTEDTFAVSPEARILTPTREAGELGDLKPGMRVTLDLTQDRRTVINIRAFKGERDRDRD